MHFQAKNTFKNTLHHNPKHDKKKIHDSNNRPN